MRRPGAGPLLQKVVGQQSPGSPRCGPDVQHPATDRRCGAALTWGAWWNIVGNMIKVVLDTNVLVAAARSRLGASFAVLSALRQRRFVALASVPLMLEYEAVLKRPEHLLPGGRTVAQVDAFLDALCLHVIAVLNFIKTQRCERRLVRRFVCRLVVPRSV